MSVTSARVFVDALVSPGVGKDHMKRLKVEEMTIGNLLDFIAENKVPRETPVFIDEGAINASVATGLFYDPVDREFQIG